jgi:hypothetical protein
MIANAMTMTHPTPSVPDHEAVMLSYLSAETSFIRAFGNRSLLLIFLCALSRGGDRFGKASALGVSLDLNPGLIAIFGPVLALLFLISLKIEADALLLAREVVLEEISRLNRSATKLSWWVFLLFAVPCATATFMTVQFILNVVPSAKAGCTGYVWTRKFTDFSVQGGSPSTYCIHNLTDGMPWIYPPVQTYLYIACLAACFYLTYLIATNWVKARATPSPTSPGDAAMPAAANARAL